MKKSGYVLAALGAIVIAAPSIASAEDIVINRDHHDGYGRDHHDGYGARADFRDHRDHGWHQGWRHRHGDNVVVLRHRHHDY
jgi:hypothetical protein